jgi:ParB family transcriptional regulator, chromosome partitioning protein
MAAKKAPKQAKAVKTPARRKRRGVTIEPTALAANELGITERAPEIDDLARAVEGDGGSVLAVYREPLGGHVLLLVALPVEKVHPTAFQRDVSEGHLRKLTRAMDKTRRFLDPVIAVRELDGSYATPNGNHRLTVLKELGAKAVIALLVPERSVAYQILALNIEKAHNLRERALEVFRMYRDLAAFSKQKEVDLELELEEPALVTLGFAYDRRPRLSGGAYNPALRKVDTWVPRALPDAMPERVRRAELVLTLDDAVTEAVAKLKEQGLSSPYLKSFVVARVNPLRFIKGDLPSFDELLATMTRRAKGMKADKIKSEDLARSGGMADED